MSKKRWLGTLLILCLVLVSALTGCGQSDKEPDKAATDTSNNENKEEPAADAEPVKLKFAMWQTKSDLDFWTEKAKEYSKVKPNVTVEVETVPDNNGQYLKVRLAANDLPDLFYMKPAHLQIYKDSLLPLDDLQVTKQNKFPAVIDGNTLGLPLVSFSEYVYYHPSIFKEVGVEVPKTLDEFVSVMEKIKAHGKYIPLSIGGKDNWTFYPISEFGPHILSGDPDYLTNLAKTAEPFGQGSTFDKVANLVKTIADGKLAGPDALAITFDQSTQLFESKKAAMIALGQWYYPDYMKKVNSEDDLGAFSLPWRSSESEELTNMTLVDQYVGVNKNSKNLQEAKAFMEWLFSKDVYQAYINDNKNISTMNDVVSDNPFFNKVSEQHPFKPFLYQAFDEKFAKVKAAAQYDEKKTAQDIFAGQPIEDVEKALNGKWKKAVEANP